MANSYVAYTGDGVSNTWTIPFPYLDDTHIHVYINGTEDTTFTFLTDSSVAATTVPADGATVLVTRETPFTSLITVIPTSGTLKGTDINDQSLQALYVVGEARDALIGTIGLTTDGLAWDAVSKPIKNVTDPTDNQDAATKGWVDSAYASALATTASNASAAASSASSAATSASNAATSASGASTSETNAAASAAAASTSETNAATSETNAASSASAASASETAAATSEANASASESAAASSASAASTSASNAATSASNAATSETNAATSYDLFDDRFLGAKASDPTLDNDGAALQTGAIYWNTTVNHLKVYTGTVWNDFVADAETSETNAAASAAAASTSETNAATSASNASTSETNAATSASNASTSETNAATSASTATTQAGIATTQATNAANSASAASTSASNAATSETNAAASYDAFDDRYLGAKASDPTLDNDGDPLLTGALYWNTTSSIMRIYNGSSWEDAALPVSSGVTLTGTPADNQIAVWTNATTVEGDAGFTWDGSKLLIDVGTIGPTAHTSADDLIVATSGATGLTIYSGATTSGSIHFADGSTGAQQYAGIVRYDHFNDRLDFATGAASRVLLHSSYLAPSTNDGLPLGSTTLGWSDLFLASGGVINFDNGDVSLTHAANSLTVAGGKLALNDASYGLAFGSKLATDALDCTKHISLWSSVYGINITSGQMNFKSDNANPMSLTSTAMVPGANNTYALGTSSLGWSDLYLGSGGTINFNNTEAKISGVGTHSLRIAADPNNTTGLARMYLSVQGTDIVGMNSTAFYSGTNDSTSLGLSTNAFSDLYLASGGQIKWGSNSIAATDPGAISIYSPSGVNCSSLYPQINDGGVLGSGTSSWSDLYLAAGGIINWDNGDVRLIHGTNYLLLSGGFLNLISDVAASTPALYVQNQSTGAGLALAEFRAHTAGTAANNDYGYIQFRVKDSAGNSQDAARFYWQATDVTDGAESIQCFWGVTTGGTYAHRLVMDGAYLRPYTHDAMYLGSAANSWSDLYLASGGVINWNASDVTLAHAANALTLSGSNSFTVEDAATGRHIRFSGGNLSPLTTNVSTLGGPSNAWADLFLGDGGTINWNNGNVVLTHSTGVLNVSTGTLQQGGSPVVLDSDIGSTVQAYSANLTALASYALSSSGDRWGVLPLVGTDGVMEIGQYIDFHESDADAGDNSLRLASTSGVLTVNSAAVRKAGKETIWVPAGALMNSAQNPYLGVFTGGATMPCTPHSGSSNAWWYISIMPPKSWNAGTLQFQAVWMQNDAGSGNVVWRWEVGAWDNSDAVSNIFDPVATVDAAPATAGDIMVGNTSSALTISTTSAQKGSMLRITFGRLATDANDTFTPSAYLLGFNMFYTADAADDT